MKVRNQFLFVISMVLLVAFCWSVVDRLLFLTVPSVASAWFVSCKPGTAAATLNLNEGH